MNQKVIIENFSQLGERLRSEQFLNRENLFQQAGVNNPWFTVEYIKTAILSIADMLRENNLQNWLSKYKFSFNHQPKTIGLVMAGNIPLVGFHDFFSVLITGNKVQCKLSSKDDVLFKMVIQELVWAKTW